MKVSHKTIIRNKIPAYKKVNFTDSGLHKNKFLVIEINHVKNYNSPLRDLENVKGIILDN